MGFDGFIKPIKAVVNWGIKTAKAQQAFNELPLHLKILYGGAKGARTGYKIGLAGNEIFAIPIGAYAFATAPRGHAVARGAASASGSAVASVLGGIVGEAIAGPIGGFIGGMAAQVFYTGAVEKAIEGPLQSMVDFGYRAKHANFGGDYRDTEIALTMRQAAAREMSGSLMNARQYLGQEGKFMHA